MNNRVTAALAAYLLATCLPLSAMAQMMGKPPLPMTAQQFSAARIGQSVQISVRIQRVERSTLYGELLEQKTETLDTPTGKHLILYFADGTPVIMGTASQVRAGAVLFVYGVVTKPGHVDIKRAVVDTKYVNVQ